MRAIERQIDGDLSALKALRGFMEVGKNVTAEDFGKFGSRLVESNPSLLAVEWIARVHDGDSRRAFEEELRRNGAPIPKITTGKPGAGKESTGLAEYNPVRFMYPLNDSNRFVLGFDMAPCKACLAVLEKAAVTGQPATMGRMPMVEKTADGYSVPVVLPAYRGGTSEITDYAMVLLQVSGMVRRALEAFPDEGIRVELSDMAGDSANRFLYSSSGKTAPLNPSEFRFQQDFAVGNRTWRLVCTRPAPGFSRAWYVLTLGLILTFGTAGHFRSRTDIAALREDAAGARQIKEKLEDLVAQRTGKLQESESRLLTALTAVSDGFWEWNVATGEAYYSPQWIRLLGYAPEEVPPHVSFFFDVIHPDDVPTLMAAMNSNTAGPGGTKDLEIRLRKKDGTYLPVSDRGRVVEWAGKGKIARMVGTITDITERKLAESKLKEDVRIAEFGSAVGACLTHGDSLTAAMRGCCAAVERTFGPGIARIWTVVEEDESLELRAEAGLATQPDGTNSRIRLGSGYVGRSAEGGMARFTNDLAKDLSARDLDWAQREGIVSFACYPLTVEGRVLGVAGWFSRRPLSEASHRALESISTAIALYIYRAEAQNALRESEERMSLILAASKDAVIAMDSRGRITSWNPQAEATFGWTADEAIGKRLSRLIVPPAQHEAHAQGLQRYLATGESRMLNKQVAVTALRRDRTEFPVELTIVPVTIRGSQQFSAFVRDVTERNRLEEHVRQAQKMETVGQLAGGIAHDFNNLLTVINGYCNWALGKGTGMGTEEAQGYFSEILKAGERAAEMTGQLLAFSRRQVIAPKVVEIDSLVSRSESLIRRMAGESIQLDIKRADSRGKIKVDPSQFHQVMLNLVANARDAMPRGGEMAIEISNADFDEEYVRRNAWAKCGAFVKLEVRDTGIGMDNETRLRVFEPFFTTKKSGTGLGLATVYGIVHQHGGWITVSSEPGIGTVFTTYWPREHAEPVPMETPQKIRTAMLGGTETILVAEDQPEVRQFTSTLLARSGYRVLQAADGLEALAVAEQHAGETIHVLLTDVVMPRLNGRELAKQINSMRPETRVIFMTGYGENLISRAGVIDDDVDLLQKPFTPEALAAKVRSVLAKKIATA
jgi:PAS domain S-box-containing protein